MERNTVWVYRTPSEASEILNDPAELALWASVGYFPAAKPAPEASIPAGPAGAPSPATVTANPVEQLPEGSQASAAGSSEPSNPPDAAGDGTGTPAPEASKSEGKTRKG